MGLKTRVGGRHIAWREVPRRGAAYLSRVALARLRLRDVDKLGAAPIALSRPLIENEGRIEIGDRFLITSIVVPSRIAVEAGAVLTIGDDVRLNYGCEIHCYERITIGDRVSIGHYSHVMDSSGHGLAYRDAKLMSPVVIEDDVWLAQRVLVLPGAHIGRGSIIASGSVVRGAIPPGVIASGNPAVVTKELKDLSPERLRQEREASMDKRSRLPPDAFVHWAESLDEGQDGVVDFELARGRVRGR